jgi:hypothetical protein
MKTPRTTASLPLYSFSSHHSVPCAGARNVPPRASPWVVPPPCLHLPIHLTHRRATHSSSPYAPSRSTRPQGESSFAIVVVVAVTGALLRSRSTVASSMASLVVRGLACSLSCMSHRSCRVHCFRCYHALLAGTNRCARHARHCCCCRELEYALHVCFLLDLTHVLCVPRVDCAECKMLPPELARTASNTTTPTSSHGYTANATHGHVVVVDFVSRS